MRIQGSRQQELAWSVFLAFIAAHFSLVYSWVGTPFLDLHAYESGHAMLPYQSRILMASIFHATVHQPWLLRAGAHLPVQLRDPFALVQIAVDFAMVLVVVAATRLSIAKLIPSERYARWASFLLLPMLYSNLLLSYGLRYTLPYDVPSLALFCAAIAAILYRRWWIFYPVFVLGTLNRETFCFVTLIFLVWQLYAEPRVSRSSLRIAAHVGVQALLWIAIKLWLHQHFLGNATEGNGTGLFRLQLLRNLHFLVNPAQYPLFVSLFGFLWIPLLLNRRYIRNRGLERVCLIVIPLWVIAMLLVGIIVEIRVFNELSALLALVAALEVWHAWFAPVVRHDPVTPEAAA